MDYNSGKILRMLLTITSVIFIFLAAAYLGQAHKTQRVRAMQLRNKYNTGMLSLQKYEKLKRENTFLNAVFNPTEVLKTD
ncbi:MAG: hypothetical protein WC546_04200 [Candidatus Omnitrophota bacterium]